MFSLSIMVWEMVVEDNSKIITIKWNELILLHLK